MHNGRLLEHTAIEGMRKRKDGLLIYDGKKDNHSRKIIERIRTAITDHEGHLMHNPMASHIQKLIKDNLPQILSGAAIAGVVGTAILAARATPQAVLEVKKAQEEATHVYEDGVLLQDAQEAADKALAEWTFLDSAKASWRCYIPAAICGTATIACVIGSNALGLRRQAALLGAYTLADASFREYKDKVLEHVTPQKAQKIDDEIMTERINKNPPPQTIIFGGGDQLCYESLTGRYFKSDAEAIRRAAQDYDARILQGDAFASLNDWFRDLGLDTTDLGELMGFNIECRLKVIFSSHVTDKEEPALAIGYEKLPVYNYDKW
jgi:hypothetical protein